MAEEDEEDGEEDGKVELDEEEEGCFCCSSLLSKLESPEREEFLTSTELEASRCQLVGAGAGGVASKGGRKEDDEGGPSDFEKDDSSVQVVCS